MPKTLTIQVRSVDAATKGLREALKTHEGDRSLPRRDGVCFTSSKAARNLLTPNRLALLRTMAPKGASSVPTSTTRCSQGPGLSSRQRLWPTSRS